MSERECHTCGELFKPAIPGLTNCDDCTARYLAGEKHLRENIRKEKEQEKLL